MSEITREQEAAIASVGKTIVSASAGSGKTFVMIEKLTRAILGGADLDSVLAVTFTKKAAVQMKDKLRDALVKAVEKADGPTRAHLKAQISKIPSASISTIHAFCSKLLRTYFYALGIESSFDIIEGEDATARELKERAIDNVFERRYENNDGDFLHLLKCYMRKRSDGYLKRQVLESYKQLRNIANYRQLIEDSKNLYTEEGFKKICDELASIFAEECEMIENAVIELKHDLPPMKEQATYDKIFAEMFSALEYAKKNGIFAPAIKFAPTDKPKDPPEERELGARFKKMKPVLAKKYEDMKKNICDEETERKRFFESGKTAVAFCSLVLEFDEEYTAVKREENKLDYNDLEHLTLQLLKDEAIKKEINLKYKYAFVDEYQDVNPVQEEIISALGEEVFLVGDIKQAIYGFRGSKSKFFAEKYNSFEKEGGNALPLSKNFRSSSKVLDFVNSVFTEAMQKDTCGIDYAGEAKMEAGSEYPADCCEVQIRILGKEKAQKEERGVYSVKEDGRKKAHSREGLEILRLVDRALGEAQTEEEKGDEHLGYHYVFKKDGTGEYVKTREGDICILTRKNDDSSAVEIVRALKDAGHSVATAQEGNICDTPEVKEVLDILSLIDNAEQDIPLATAMLSPLGGFTESELAAIRIAFKYEKRISFRECCGLYMRNMRGAITKKLQEFYGKIEKLRSLSEILSAGELIDIIIGDSGLEASLSAGNGEKLKNVLTLASEGYKLTLSAFLNKLKTCEYKIAAPASSSSDSIRVMTMHKSKGLEFPVVIIADICRSFKGMDFEEIPFDEQFGFAPRHFDAENMLVNPTILRKLIKLRADKEELKNELNVFYVACTRAMCKLYIVAEKKTDYSLIEAMGANCYAKLFDMSRFPLIEKEPREDIGKSGPEVTNIVEPDEKLYGAVQSHFMQDYRYAKSVELPVKSSASAILKSRQSEEPYFVENSLFGSEGETGIERGKAYHKFLELCDFSIKSLDGIKEELVNFTQSGRLKDSEVELLDAEELCEIVNMPVFDGLEGAELMPEQEFLCRLKACELFQTEAEDYVFVQGAIDLLVRKGNSVRIIDYKYSKKTDEHLKETYSAQLALYKKVVSVIWHVPEAEISTTIVNIYRRTFINL